MIANVDKLCGTSDAFLRYLSLSAGLFHPGIGRGADGRITFTRSNNYGSNTHFFQGFSFLSTKIFWNTRTRHF